MEIFKLFGSIFVDTEEADKSISKTDKKAGGLGETLLKGATTAGKFAVGLGTAAAAGATALVGIASKAAESSKEISIMSERIGFSSDAYQEWSYIAQQCGSNMDTLQGGITDLAEKMDDARTGTGEAAEIFDKLGISVVDANGNLRDQQSVFEETITALQGVENAAERQALATKLMSTTGEELLPLLNGQIGTIDELKNSAHDLGLVMTEETVSAGTEFAQTFEQIKSMLSVMVTQIGTAVMPIIQQLLEWVMENMPTIKAIFGEVFVFIGDIVQAAMVIIEALMPVVEKVFGFIGHLWNSSLKPMLENIIEFVENIFTGNLEGAFRNLINIIKGIWDGIILIIKEPLNGVISIINKFIDGLNQLKIPDWVPGIGGKGINIQEIPLLAKGGNIIGDGHVIVGDAGPELLSLPAGARVTPLANSHGDLLGTGETVKILRLILTELKLLRLELYDTLVDALVNGVEIDWSDRTLARLIRKYAG